jgi:serine protease Do
MDQIVKYGHVQRGIMGLSLAEVTQKDAQADKLSQAGIKEIRGALVGDFPTDVASPAKDAGVQKGDIIVQANGRDIDHVSTLQRVVREEKPGDIVTLQLVRNGTERTVRVKLAEAPKEQQSEKLASR